MKEKVLILNSNPYRMVDEVTGSINEGLIVRYVSSLNGVKRNQFSGVDVVKGNFPISNLSLIKAVPAYYEIEFTIGADGKGKPKLIYSSLNYVSDLKMA